MFDRLRQLFPSKGPNAKLREMYANYLAARATSYTKCEPERTSRCFVSLDSKSITFYPCGITSHHPMDVDNRYCALCGRFL